MNLLRISIGMVWVILVLGNVVVYQSVNFIARHLNILMGNLCLREESTNQFNMQQDDDFPVEKTQATTIMIEDAEKEPRDFQRVSLADFKKLKQLGRGAFGKVYLAELQHSSLESPQQYAMKVIEKRNITKDSHRRHIHDERVILEKVRSDFVVRLRYAFQTPRKLYLLVDLMAGGELFFLLRQGKFQDEYCIKFYAAEILFGLEHLHNMNVIYRDLKPENILLTGDGHLKLSDFGLSKMLKFDNQRADTSCGTPDYLAPEVVMSQNGYTKTCDFWSLGCLIYEMFTGRPPLYQSDKRTMFKMRLTMDIPIPQNSSKEAQDLLKGLLKLDIDQRLGAKGASQVLRHDFFKSLDLERMRKLEIQPPITNIKMFKNFDQRLITKTIVETPNNGKTAYEVFEGFSYQYHSQSIKKLD